ncbi:hypothetical protein LEP1GSC148_0096 [Leptospira interrogans serovar Canicola str. LT1962]|uniref:Uncharacterized protein n=1 Tax=Leptospira interrogans serovar Lora str. TE 1992 TaxID=1193028 RepID=M3F300_LEPIR|nr:hypothetical protein LEP1GSC067_2024 [Leptospira interrogans serovar Lora str. TE 1992]EMF74286.1 hypothetical protein LEP1GSC148_0096 [Leptospira interrogans serovar Canicola str. LT1962]
MNFQYPYALLLLIPVWIWAFIYYKNKIYLKKWKFVFQEEEKALFPNLKT